MIRPGRGTHIRGTAARFGLTTAHARRFRPRLRRRTVALLTLLALLALAAAFWATLRQTALLRETLESQLSESFGMQVSIDTVQWDGWNTIKAEGLTLRVPGWPAPADEVATIKRAVVIFEPLTLMSGRLKLVDMEVDGLTIRVVEDVAAPGKFNVLAIKPKTGGAGSVGQPQRALMRDLQLELGLLRDGKFELIAHRAFTGAFEHVPDDPSLYSFELSQINTPGQPEGTAPIRLFGTWDERTFAYEVTLDSLAIGQETIALLPLQARTWAQATLLGGRIESARISGRPTDLVSYAEIQVRDVTLRDRDAVRTMPWARMVGDEVTPMRGDVSVRLPRGTLTVRGSRVEIAANDARIMPGRPGSGAVEIPVELRFGMDMGATAPLAFNLDAPESWLNATLNTAPFDLRVKLTGVSALPGADGTPRPVELPLPLVEVLREFGARDWLADIDFSASRGAPTTTADGAVVPGALAVKGRLALSDGTVRYGEFPYQLDRVTGVIAFDGATATIHNLVGKGSERAMLTISGNVHVGDGTDPGLDIRIVGTDVPVDERLLSGLDPLTREILDSLLDRTAFASLRAANLSDDTWAPGGRVGFDMRVFHESGSPLGTQVSGDIQVHEAQAVIDSFPYPLRVKGAVRLEDEAVVLVGDGFTAVTPGGGTGRVWGRIDTPRVGDSRQVSTHLQFAFEGETFSPLMLAAIPVSFAGDQPPPPGWPGRVRAPIAELLTALGASGSLTITGTVGTDAAGDGRVETSVRIRDGGLAPTPELPRVLRRYGLSWPGQMKLTDVDGTVKLAPEGLTMEGLTASRGAGRADARGRFATDGTFGELIVRLNDFPLARDFIDITDSADRELAYRAWQALRPEGSFDGLVEWRNEHGRVTTTAHAQLNDLTVAGGQVLTPVCGDFIYLDGTVHIKDLEWRGTGPTGEAILLTADGTLLGDDAHFTAQAHGLTLAAPLVAAALRAGDQGALADTLSAWHMDGGFTAEAFIGGSLAEGDPWELRVEPTWVTGLAEGSPFAARVHRGSIVARPRGVAFEGLEAMVMHGEVALNGSIGPDESGATVGDLLLGVRLMKWSTDLEAVLPRAARGALRGIEFTAHAPVMTDGLRIRFRMPEEGAADVTVVGRLDIAQGTFRAGTTFTEADGSLLFDLSTVAGRPSGAITLDFDRLYVVDREASDVHARLVFDAPSNTVTLDDMEAWMYGGRLVGFAKAELGGAYQASVSFVNVKFAPFAEATDTPEQRAAAWAARGSEDGPGRMRGRFQLSGVFGRPDLQRGTGRVNVADARMVEFPLGLSILQLSQLMLPLNAALDRADAEFEVVADVLTFERFLLASSTLRLEGSGSLSLTDGDLALRFRNRGTLPVVSDLFGAVLGDQMFMIDVGGTLQDPQPHLVPIPILAPEPTLPVTSTAYRKTDS